VFDRKLDAAFLLAAKGGHHNYFLSRFKEFIAGFLLCAASRLQRIAF
jgi:hypothetical protein